MQTVCKFRVFYRFLGQNRYLHLHLALYLHKTFVSICFQRLIVSIISSTDEDSDVGLKDSQSLVTVILTVSAAFGARWTTGNSRIHVPHGSILKRDEIINHSFTSL